MAKDLKGRVTDALKAQAETAILDFLWEEVPESAYKDKEIKDLSKKVFKYVLGSSSETFH